MSSLRCAWPDLSPLTAYDRGCRCIHAIAVRVGFRPKEIGEMIDGRYRRLAVLYVLLARAGRVDASLLEAVTL